MRDLRAVLAANLERLLAEKRMEKKDLASKARMPASSISRYLAKKQSATIDVVERLANALGVGAAELIAEPGDGPSREITHSLHDCTERVVEAAWFYEKLIGHMEKIRAGAKPNEDMAALERVLALVAEKRKA